MNTRCVVRWVAAAAFGVCTAVGVAEASGLNLHWGAYCPTSASSMFSIEDPCDGSSQMSGVVYALVGSFKPPVTLGAARSEEFSVVFSYCAAQLSDYWHLEDENQPSYSNPAGCRGTNSINGNVGSLRVNVNDSAFPATFNGCSKLWGNSASGGIDWLIGGPNYGHLKGTFSSASTHPVTAGTQYGCFIATIASSSPTS